MSNQLPGIKIVSTGKYVPPLVVSNDDLAKIVDTSDEWITTRTGIKNRHKSEGQNVLDMAYLAALNAIEKSTYDVSNIDLIVVATITSDFRSPSVANLLQAKLGLNNAKVMSFDINAACTGFVYALEVTSSLLSSGRYKAALVIGSEHMTSVVDYTDRNTCILFGDGAGAVIVEPSKDKADIPVFFNASKGDDEGILKVDHTLYMEGKKVYQFAIGAIPAAINHLLNESGLSLADIDIVIPHQANQRIVETVAKHMDIPIEKFAMNIADYGNTSSASIPILLEEYKTKHPERLRVLIVGFGGGFTWGGAIFNV